MMSYLGKKVDRIEIFQKLQLLKKNS